MTHVLYALTAVSAVIAALVGLLYLGHRHAVRDRRPPTLDSQPAPTGLAAAGPGWLSDEEREAETWYADGVRRDLERLDAICDRLVLHRLNVVVENALRQLLPPEDRGWARIHSGEYRLAGVA